MRIHPMALLFLLNGKGTGNVLPVPLPYGAASVFGGMYSS